MNKSFDYTISIVSHGDEALACRIIYQLKALDFMPKPARVILTLNKAGEEDNVSLLNIDVLALPFKLVIVQNDIELGFAQNHNNAFETDTGLGGSDWFFVLNPDIGLSDSSLSELLDVICNACDNVGLVYPVQFDSHGNLQDFEREYPTPFNLFKRYFFKLIKKHYEGRGVDWVNAAFIAVRNAAWRDVNGFDSGYRLYAEDVDFCLRLRQKGWLLEKACDSIVIHEARRASHSNLRYFLWHVSGLFRLWSSPAWIFRDKNSR